MDELPTTIEYKEQAEYYRIGLLTGLLIVANVVAWADTEIARAEKPQYFFIELSLMGRATVHNVCRKLREFPGEVDKFKIIRRVLADMYLSSQHAPRYKHVFARGLYQLWVDCNCEVPEDLEFISWLEEAYGSGVLGEFLEPFNKMANTIG